ncbi:hypothetical protein [Pseudorhodobacter sp. MZDSW-24AT]|uniref:hypothetical protein n=1 Tax=Pseudorhodobacter sp. MZDSW-24AT TaxID=2052957 RepID=UPI000C1DDAE0|nr:hypothetical protein [Pseudorhodobacter sp. MZDSW-24AT]PJF09550.1 hypothetical protein CUR21_06480 [Pseudorhodobacter sp. MZDSW-24AT]
MIDALRAAGFPGVEAEGQTIHARLWASSNEFTATPEEGRWRLALHWPLRATMAQRAEWNATHPGAPLDIHNGETRLSLFVQPEDSAALLHWAALAEAAVAQMIRWRRAQRQPGEGY